MSPSRTPLTELPNRVMLVEWLHRGKPTALGVARHYRDLVGTFVLDERDAGLRGAVETLGMRCVVTDTIMADRSRAAALAKVVADG